MEATDLLSPLLVLILPIVLLAVGCGGQFDATVHGVVTIDGEAAPRGSVAFQPVGSGMMARGEIASNGSYQLKSNSDRGLTAGEYRVLVDIREPAKFPEGAGFPTPGRLLIEAKYTRGESSDLVFQVTPGSNRIDIDLPAPK